MRRSLPSRGLPPVGVLAELVNDDGTVTKGRQVAEFAKRHKLKLFTVADLIAYRQSREKLVERVASFPVETPIGPLQGHAFVTPFDPVNHFAFVHGDIGEGRDVLTRLHRAHILQDVFGGGRAINGALARFKEAGRGVLIYLRDGASGVPVATLPDGEHTRSEVERSRQWREIGLGAQILRDLGVSSIRLLASHERTYVGLSGFGIEIVATEAVEC